MTITPDELIGAIKYDLAANGCNYPIVYKTSVEGDKFRVSCLVYFQEDFSESDDPTMAIWVDRVQSFSSNDLIIGLDINHNIYADEVIRLSSDIQAFIKSENLTV